MSWLDRTALLIGEESMEKLKNSTVAIVGLGGVGGSAAEAICRMGVGRLILIDNDDVDDTNRNRQLFATAETVGMDKVDAAAMRLRGNPFQTKQGSRPSCPDPEGRKGSEEGVPVHVYAFLLRICPLPFYNFLFLRKKHDNQIVRVFFRL